jgi:hypothetical protein
MASRIVRSKLRASVDSTLDDAASLGAHGISDGVLSANERQRKESEP